MKSYENFKSDINKLEQICSEGVDVRFKETIIVKDNFKKTIDLLNASSNIMIVTGFCIKDVMVGETDGPIGSVCMAKALEELGKQVCIVTDKFSDKFIEAGIEHYNLRTSLECVDINFEEKDAYNLIEEKAVDLLLFIERPSKNRDGNFCSMKAESITGIIPDTDYIFEVAKSKGIDVIAIGDGGNEVGMDLIRDKIVKNVDKGEIICASTRADLLIVSGVSNWACYSVAAGLSVTNNKNLLPTVKDEISHLNKIVELGAVDGVSKKTSATVDGYSLERNMQVLIDLARVVFKVETKEFIS